MKKEKLFYAFCTALVLLNSASFASEISCPQHAKPKAVKPLFDWDIIAANKASIPTKDAFTGINLRYTFIATPKNPTNIVSINHDTGELHVKADAKDKFDVTIQAKNRCGIASATFNVMIDEEE